MCSPEAVLIAGAAMQGAGAFVGAEAEASSLEAQSQIAATNANLKEISAREERLAGAKRETRLRQDASRLLSEQVSATAGAGIDIGGATAREVFESTERVGIADVLEEQRNTRKKVWAFEVEAAGLRQKAGALKKAAKRTELIAPLLFVAPLVEGLGQARVAEKTTSTKGTS